MERLEERLVAPRHFFQSIFTHKGSSGQYRNKGGIVNVPVTVDTYIVDALDLKPFAIFDKNGIEHNALAHERIISSIIADNGSITYLTIETLIRRSGHPLH
jgi:hypothetical protein